jgi:hypothetical protein
MKSFLHRGIDFFYHFSSITFDCHLQYLTQFNSSASKLIFRQAGVLKRDSSLLSSSDCVLLRPLGTDITENTASTVKEVCLLIPYLAMDVLLSHAGVL